MIKVYLLYRKNSYSNQYSLYAWSDSKKIVKDFKSIREQLNFFEKKIEFEYDSDYELFREEKLTCKIKPMRLTYKSKWVHILCSKNVWCTDDELSIIGDETQTYPFFVDNMLTPPAIFGDGILDALDMLGYTYLHSLYLGYDSLVDEACHNMSYKLSPLGNKLSIEFDAVEVLANFISNGGECHARNDYEDL